ncbi:MAG: NusG domain II-containing protein [Hominilimicola sp.]
MTEFKKNLKWALAFLLLIIICTLVILFHNNSSKTAKTAEIIQNGEVIRTVDLQNVPMPYEFEVISPDGGYNTVRVEYGKIGIIHASCPDQICVKQGFIADGVLPVVCLPNKLSVVITDDSSELDAVAGGITQ